jgi:hypothetical protein
MLSFRPEQWGSMEHDTEESSDMYGMSPGNWTKPDARETSEAEQHRKVYNNGGLGHAYDYGVGPEVVAPSWPLSAGVAAVGSEVRLG